MFQALKFMEIVMISIKTKKIQFVNKDNLRSTKLSGEYLTKNFSEKYKLNYIIIRPFNLFGKYSHLYGPFKLYQE